jgi:PAS domain S-box-containing protein
LDEVGLTTIEAENSTEAVRIARSGDVAAVLVSTRLGDDGVATTRNLKNDPRTANIPILILSSSSSTDDYAHAVEAGADAWLAEPVDAPVLIRITRAILARSQSDDRACADAELRERYEQLRAIVDQAGVGFVRATLAGQFTSVNQSFCDITGYSRVELLSMNYRDITHPDDLDINREYSRRLVSGELRQLDFEKRYVRKDGSTVWVKKSLTRVAQKGFPDFLFAIAEDITERKRVEQEFQRQLEFDRITSGVLTRFAACSAREFDQILVDSLRVVAEYCNGDHAFVVVRNMDDGTFRCAGEWCAPHVKPLVVPPQPVTAEDYPWSASALALHELVLHDVNELPPEAAAERAWLEEQGAVAGLRVPLDTRSAREEEVPGCIIVLRYDHRRRWSNTDVTRVRIMGNAVAAVMERKRAEELLRQSDQRFNLLFQAIPEPTIITAVADEKITEVNSRFLTVSGYRRDELIGKTTEELDLFASEGDRKRAWSELLEKGWLTDLEVGFRVKSGTVLIGLLSSVAVEVLGQKYLVSTIRDITQRRQAEDMLHRHAAFDKLLTDLLAEFVRCDITELSVAIEKTLGAVAGFFAADHLMIFEVAPETKTWRITREWCAPHVAPIARANGHDSFCSDDLLSSDNDVIIDAGDSVTGAGYDVERLRAEGATVVLNVPIKGSAGMITGRIGLHRHGGRTAWTREDSSRLRVAGNAIFRALERIRAEESVRASDAHFRILADSAQIVTWISGPDNTGVFYNKWATAFSGRTTEQLSGTGWMEIVHPDDRDSYVATCFAAFDSRQPFSAEARMRRADGEYRWCLVSGVPRVVDGVYQGHVGTSLDITDLKLAYEQRFNAQRLESLGLLAARIAHDFNNLLGAMVVRAESALGDLQPDAPAAEDMKQILLTARRAADIISQTITFARDENVSSSAVDLSDMVTQMVELLKISISKAAILKLDLASNLPHIDANAAAIQQVIMNLVINASKALEDKPGQITIRTAPGPRRADSAATVRLEVEDTGCGMTDEVKARIFDPFFTTRFTGHGLGLSAVQGIIRRLGGSIEVESTPGKGSRFVILLPCDSARISPMAKPVSPPRSATAPGVVLLIEDEDSLRLVVAKLLRKRGFQVIEAADGVAALQSMKSDPGGIGVVLLDLTLPGMPGSEIFDELRRIRPDVKVVLCTAFSREKVAEEFGARDIQGFIRKPYQIAELEELILQVSAS